MHNKGFHLGKHWSEKIEKDLDRENSFVFDSYRMIAARNENFILAVRHNDIVKKN